MDTSAYSVLTEVDTSAYLVLTEMEAGRAATDSSRQRPTAAASAATLLRAHDLGIGLNFSSRIAV